MSQEKDQAKTQTQKILASVQSKAHEVAFVLPFSATHGSRCT
jgi:hypothetical protein